MRAMWCTIVLVASCASRRPPPAPPPDPDVEPTTDAPANGCPAQFGHDLPPACDGTTRCTYPEGTCFCVPTCHGGAAIVPGTVDPPPHWECFAKPPAVRADGCPGEPPAAGGACSGSLRCSYGLDTTGVCWGYTMACGPQGWTAIPQSPPP